MTAADASSVPEADRFGDTPHPRETAGLVGHQAAEAALLDAYRSGRMPHAWILAGPAGVGKATLAYRLARFVLAHPDPEAADVQAAADLAVDSEHPAARRVARLSHPNLMVLRRGWNTEKKNHFSVIRVDEVRRALAFFASTAGQGGWRVCIVDTADDLNAAAANALLKVLEEPPQQALFLLLSVAPRRLLATIRSRCRLLPMQRLADDDLAEVLRRTGLAADLDDADLRRLLPAADGSVRRAAAFLDDDALALRAAVAALLDALPAVDHAATLALADRLAGAAGAGRFTLAIEFVLDWLHARARAAALAGEPRLARWAELWDKTARAAREAEIYNLDRRPLVLAMVADLAAAARG